MISMEPVQMLNMAVPIIDTSDSIHFHKCRLVSPLNCLHDGAFEWSSTLTDGIFSHLHFAQGDLDRQRLLGNRQRIALYEAGAIDDNNEGLEHQER